jgi:hypothetical protein
LRRERAQVLAEERNVAELGHGSGQDPDEE